MTLRAWLTGSLYGPRLVAPAVATLVNRGAVDGLTRSRLTLASRPAGLLRLLTRLLLLAGLALLLLLGPLLNLLLLLLRHLLLAGLILLRPLLRLLRLLGLLFLDLLAL